MPTAPTPGPPQSACARAASARSHGTVGMVRSANSENSRDTHIRSAHRANCPPVTGAPGVPNSDGRYTVYPALTRRSPKAYTPGCSPGISCITITAGPLPSR